LVNNARAARVGTIARRIYAAEPQATCRPAAAGLALPSNEVDIAHTLAYTMRINIAACAAPVRAVARKIVGNAKSCSILGAACVMAGGRSGAGFAVGAGVATGALTGIVKGAGLMVATAGGKAICAAGDGHAAGVGFAVGSGVATGALTGIVIGAGLTVAIGGGSAICAAGDGHAAGVGSAVGAGVATGAQTGIGIAGLTVAIGGANAKPATGDGHAAAVDGPGQQQEEEARDQ